MKVKNSNEEVKLTKFYPFSNSRMFALVMHDKSICKPFLEMIFEGKKIKSLIDIDEADTRDEKFIEVEKTIIPNVTAKSVRLDVVFEGEEEVFDIELQMYEEPDIARRTRYYHASNTVRELKSGSGYRKLKDNYVIFVCTYDPFKLDMPSYNFTTYDAKNSLQLDDGQFTIILNTKCSKNKVPSNWQDFFDYMNTGNITSDNMLLTAIHNKVLDENNQKEVQAVMTLEEQFKVWESIAHEKGLEKGVELGTARGERNKSLETARNMKLEKLDSTLISRVTGLSIEEIDNL